MSTAAIISLIVGILGIIGGVILNYLKILKISKDNEFSKVINLKNSDILDLKNELKILRTQNEKLQTNTFELEAVIIRLKSLNLNYPFPFCIKDNLGKIIIVNTPWCLLNKISRVEAIGEYDYNLFPKELSEVFRKTDLETVEGKEGFLTFQDPQYPENTVIKWRIPSVVNGEFYIALISLKLD